MAIEKALYTATATATGGRAGTAKSADGVLDLALTTPKELGGNGAVGRLGGAGAATGGGGGGGVEGFLDGHGGSFGWLTVGGEERLSRRLPWRTERAARADAV